MALGEVEYNEIQYNLVINALCFQSQMKILTQKTSNFDNEDPWELRFWMKNLVLSFLI